MIKVAIVIPYMELLEVYTECSKKLSVGREIEFQINNIRGTRDNFIKECSADIIVARGITSAALRNERHEAYIIDIEVTGYDIFNAIISCKNKFDCDNVGIIITKNVLCDIESLKQIAGANLTVFKVNDENDIINAIKAGEKSGIKAFIGGTTAKKICDEMGIKCIIMEVGPEAVENSVRIAIDAAESINNERSKTIIMKNVLNNTKNGVMAITKKGNVEEINLEARDIFGISQGVRPKEIIIEELFPRNEWKEVIKKNVSKDIFFKKQEMLYMANISPLFIEGDVNGVLITIHNAEQVRETESKIRAKLRKKGLVAKYNIDDILGESGLIKQAKKMSEKYSKVNSNVLIVGETGTGKELFAHSIHNLSKRNMQPFVAVNCAAVPENLLESELFGYSEGAFSGAIRGGKMGLFELAHGGTIFLDEIGEMPFNLQAKILRVLEEKEVRRVGDDKVIPIDVRVISATNIDMPRKIAKGEFRIDLYYRLNLLDITVAPLRERKKDIPILVGYFIEQAASKNFLTNIDIDERGVIELCKWSWSGNVRELRNICERLVVLSEYNYITEEDVKALCPADSVTFTEEDRLSLLKKDDDINLSSIKKNELARAMGISRTTLWRRLKNASK